VADNNFEEGVGDSTYEVTEGDKEAEGLDAVPENLQLKATSTTNPARPRTIRAGYNHETEVLTVVFRDGTWWNYYDVPVDMWEAFKGANSKGVYLRESGLDNWPSMGAVDMSSVSKHQRVMLAYTVSVSRRLQQALKGKQSTKLFGKGVDYRTRKQGGFKPGTGSDYSY
jgi:KTSC domain